MIYDKIKFYHNVETRQNIFDYKNFHKIGNKGKLIHYKKIINFKSLIGESRYSKKDINRNMLGNTYEIELEGNIKYKFYMDEIIPETNKLRRMCFLSNSQSYDCLCVLFGTKKIVIITN